MKGVEPSRPYRHWPLMPAWLPLHHIRKILVPWEGFEPTLYSFWNCWLCQLVYQGIFCYIESARNLIWFSRIFNAYRLLSQASSYAGPQQKSSELTEHSLSDSYTLIKSSVFINFGTGEENRTPDNTLMRGVFYHWTTPVSEYLYWFLLPQNLFAEPNTQHRSCSTAQVRTEIKIGGPGETWTHDSMLKRHVLWPTELPALKRFYVCSFNRILIMKLYWF